MFGFDDEFKHIAKYMDIYFIAQAAPCDKIRILDHLPDLIQFLLYIAHIPLPLDKAVERCK